jgi:CRP-like cAMP-binding protein
LVRTVLSGRIKLRRRTRDGRNSLGAIVGAGEYFGELSLLDAGPRTADALGATDSQLAIISRQAFVGWAERNPQFALQALNQPRLARRARLWPAPVLPAITPTTMEASR